MNKKDEGALTPTTSTRPIEGCPDNIKPYRGLLKSWKDGRNPDAGKYHRARFLKNKRRGTF